MKPKIIYGLYKGDEFIDVGTAEELAKKLGVKKETIWFYASPTNLKRNKNNNRIEAVKFIENLKECADCKY